MRNLLDRLNAAVVELQQNSGNEARSVRRQNCQRFFSR